MNEAINSLTSEMVRSCHVSSFYMKWRTNEDDEAMVRALTEASYSARGAADGGGGRLGRASQVTSSRATHSESSTLRRSNATASSTTSCSSRTVVRVLHNSSDNGNEDRIEEDLRYK